MELKFYSSDDELVLAALRRQIRDRLPEDLRRALREYQNLTADCAGYDAKTFATHQAACRAVLVHIQLLLRLAEWGNASIGHGEEIGDDEALDHLIRDAEAFVAKDAKDAL